MRMLCNVVLFQFLLEIEESFESVDPFQENLPWNNSMSYGQYSK